MEEEENDLNSWLIDKNKRREFRLDGYQGGGIPSIDHAMMTPEEAAKNNGHQGSSNNGHQGSSDRSAKTSGSTVYRAATSPQLQSPDLSSIMEEYDRLMEETKREKEGWRKASGIGVLTDLGLLIGDAIGANGNANVNRREAVTGKFNEQTEKLQELYRNMAARRPELAAQMLQRKFQNDLALGNYNLSAENQKEAKAHREREVERRQKWRDEDIAREESRYQDDKTYKDKVFGEGVRQSGISNSLAREQLELQKGKLENDVLFIAPHKDDSNSAIQTRANKRVLPVKLTKSEIDSYAAMAVADRNFAAANPELFKKLKLKGFDVEKTEATGIPAVDAKAIATAYLQYTYDKDFTATQATPATQGYQGYPWEYIPGLGGSGYTAPGMSPPAPVNNGSQWIPNSNSNNIPGW
jgi:hypothetical protein